MCLNDIFVAYLELTVVIVQSFSHQRNRESMIMVDKHSIYMIKVDNPLPWDYHIHVSIIYHYCALTNSLMHRYDAEPNFSSNLGPLHLRFRDLWLDPTSHPPVRIAGPVYPWKGLSRCHSEKLYVKSLPPFRRYLHTKSLITLYTHLKSWS